MKILLATYWFLPHQGGVNDHINLLKKELTQAGHHVDVLAHHPEMDKIYMLTTGRYIKKEKIKEVVYQKVLAYYLRHQPYVEPWIRWREIERYTYELIAVLFQLDQYDLIHAHDALSSRAIARVKPSHVPLVTTLHDLISTQHLLSGEIRSTRSLPWYYACQEEFVGLISADAAIVPTAWLKKKLNGPPYHVPKEKMFTVPYGMDHESFVRRLNEKSDQYIPFTEKGNRVLLCPAPLTPQGGHQTLLKALAYLKNENDRFDCWIVGSGKMDQELMAITYRYGLEKHVHFLGERQDLPQLIANSDIIVLPGVEEHHPYAIMAAQLAGKVIVSAKQKGSPEMVKNGETGFLVTAGKHKQLADVLKRLLANPDLGKQVAFKGETWGKNQWSSHTFLENTMSVYQRAISSVNEKGA